jgi:DNA replication and repair protein RecF
LFPTFLFFFHFRSNRLPLQGFNKPTDLHLEKLILTQFKNYAGQTLELSERLNCFTGLNGMGKTNILDAVYYLCLTKSRFGLSDAHLCRQGEDFFRLEGHFRLQQKPVKIVAKVQPRKRKLLENNDVPYPTLSEHIGLFPVVFIGPDDTLMITEGSEERRRFIDNTLSQTDPTYLRQLMAYNQILQQRNAALKQQAEQRRFDQALISVYDAQLAPAGQYIHQKRREFVAEFAPIMQATYDRICGSREIVSCSYRSALEERPLEELLLQSIEKDRILQRTTEGVHRDDLDLLIHDLPVKRFGSQGQLKSFVLALKLAQYDFLEKQKNMRPILLLDDIFDKLDAERVSSLLQLLHHGNFGQVFITDTDEHRVENIIREFNADYRRYRIENGSARQQNAIA